MKRTSAACLCHLNPRSSRCVTSVVAPQSSVLSLRCPERKACVGANTHTRCRITDTLEVTRGHVSFRTRCLTPSNHPECNSFSDYFLRRLQSPHRAVLLAVAVSVVPSLFFSHFNPVTHTGSHRRHPPLTRSSIFGLFFC